jgi:hypothetical protein
MRTDVIKYVLIFSVVSVLTVCLPVKAAGDDSVKLTITPPLIKVNMNPGERWTSSVKVVNNSTQPTTVYAQTQDFKSGENGGVVFIPNPEAELAEQNYLLSQWIKIDSGSIEIPAQQSVEIPFSIEVPPDAGPGGRYAAILTGTRPGDTTQGTAIRVSSLLASLIMLNIRGDVVERGQIREFSTEKSFYRNPKVKFTVRFENTGNIHLQPQGEIVVYDMYGEEQEKITVNHSTELGNVLPDSTRPWQFKWKAKGGWTRMGRYTANLVIGYGNNSRKTDNRTVYFWVVDFNFLGKILGGIIIMLLLLVWMIRAYIRRAVISTQRQVGLMTSPGARQPGGVRVIPGRGSLKQKRMGRSPFKRYIVPAIIVLVAAVGVIVWSGGEPENVKTLKHKNNLNGDIAPVDVREDDPERTDTSNITSTEERIIEKEDGLATTTVGVATSTKEIRGTEDDIEIGNSNIFGEKFIIRVLNGSGESGVAGKAAKLLREGGFEVESLGNADMFDYSATVIEYQPARSQLAKEIGALLPIVTEKKEVEDLEEDIVVIIGKDF